MPARARDSHKGEMGRVLVVAGSEGMVGAAALVGGGALRAGAGLVTIGTPRSCYPILAAQVTCAMTWPLPETPTGSISRDAVDLVVTRARLVDAVAIGPGLGRDPETQAAAREIVTRCEKPIVADADALFALEGRLQALENARAPVVLTPHAGELGRLLGMTAGAIQSNREAAVRAFAERAPRCVLVLKGAGTIVAQGERLYRSTTGNPGMATGGTGDVLSGAIAALLARGLDPFDAAALGVWAHGRAGDLVRERMGENGMIASDVRDALPMALREAVDGSARPSVAAQSHATR